MMWQDVVFLIGSTFSLAVLWPTLRRTTSCVPRETSIPSALFGLLYSLTFFTLGMRLAAFGALIAGTMWALIAALRASPVVFPENETGDP